MDRKIIVFGATGNTGIKICNSLNVLKIKHTAFVREGSESKIPIGLTEIIPGDVLQKKDVINGISVQNYTDIIIALGSRDLKSSNVRSNGTKNIVETLKSNSQGSKLHVISAHGIGDSWNRLKWHEKLISKLLIGKTMKDHELQEEIIRTNSGGFHIIRPVALKNDAPTGKIFCSNDEAMPNGSIARADVAKYLVDSMLNDTSGENSICKM